MTYQYIWTEDLTYQQEIYEIVKECLGHTRAKDAIDGLITGAVKFLVVKDSDKIVACSGYGRVYFYKNSWFIGFNSVTESHRGQRIGHTMTDMRVKLIQELGGEYIWSANKSHWKRMIKFNFAHHGELESNNETHHLMIKGLVK